MQLVLSHDDNAVSDAFLQSRFWAQFKELGGWTYKRFWLTDADSTHCISLMERPMPLGMSFAYIPRGIGLNLETLGKILKPHVSKNCVFIRFDPSLYHTRPIDDEALFSRPLFTKPLFKANDVQPPDTVILDLNQSPEDILKDMKPKWRYNIGLAKKKNVSVSHEPVSSTETKALAEFYDMYKTTAIRDKIAIHPFSYYRDLFCIKSKNPNEPAADIRLWMARYEGKAIAAIITVFYGKEAIYLYGASADTERNRMPAYALQWAAIQAACEYGCSTYDFFGISPKDNMQHPMAGLYRFKTGFGGHIRHYSGAWDYALKPLPYFGFRIVEQLRTIWYKIIKKHF